MSLNDGDNVVQLRRPATISDIGAKPRGFAAGATRHPRCGTVIHFPADPVVATDSQPPSPAHTPLPAGSANSRTDWPTRPGPAREPIAPQAMAPATTAAATQQREAIERGENEGMRVAPV